MSFRTYLEQGYEPFIRENRDRPDDIWFFIHIPKTAGTSFRAEIASILSPEANINVYDEPDNMPHRRKLERSVERFIQAHESQPYRFASGHVPTEMLERRTVGPVSPKLFTILRDPVSRFVSDYRYQRTSEHPGNEAFRTRFPRIEDYLADVGQRNRMWQYLAPTADASVAQTIVHLLDRFTFVGLLEMYPLSFRVMMRLLGTRRDPSMHLRRTSDKEAGEVSIPPRLLEQIREANQKDVELYDAIHSGLLPMRAATFESEA